MDIQNIVKDLQKWQEENKENRSVIIITSECIAKSERGGKRTSASLIGVVGSEGMLVPSLANAITQHSDFIALLRKATKVVAIDTISQTIKDVN
jgi:hypothetical protein